MSNEDEHKMELIFSAAKWEIIQKAINKYRTRERYEGVLFSSDEIEEREYPVYFTIMCEEWLKHQNMYAMVKAFIKETQKGF